MFFTNICMSILCIYIYIDHTCTDVHMYVRMCVRMHVLAYIKGNPSAFWSFCHTQTNIWYLCKMAASQGSHGNMARCPPKVRTEPETDSSFHKPIFMLVVYPCIGNSTMEMSKPSSGLWSKNYRIFKNRGARSINDEDRWLVAMANLPTYDLCLV